MHPGGERLRDRDGFVWTNDLEAGGEGGVDRVGIELSKLFDYAVNEGSLGERNGPAGPVTLNGNAKGILYRAEIRNFPVFTEVRFEAGVLVNGGRDGDDVVDVDGKNSNACVSYVTVNTPFRRETGEAKLCYSFMKCLVSNATILEKHQKA